MIAALEQLTPGHKYYEPHGNAKRLMYCRDSEMCIHGPVGTGKTRAGLEKFHLCAMKYPKMRALLVRKTRASLTQSALQIFEDHVIKEGDPIKAGAGRAHRQSYKYPNGSEIVVGGLDNPDRIMSTEYDMIGVEEAVEATVEDWEKLTTRLRSRVMPYRQIIGMCNPSARTHWLRLRMDERITTEFQSKYEDNPVWWDHEKGDWTEEGREYIAKLDRLTGVRYLRLRKGLWVTAEGAIWPNFDSDIHVIDAWDDQQDPIQWHFADVDWGFDRPGVIHVWGVTRSRRAILVCEIYMSEKNMDWWCEVAVRLQNQFGIRSFVCDPSRPDNIDLLNHKLYQVDDHNCAIPGINAFDAGANVVRDRLALRPDGKPGVFFLRNALDEIDQRMVTEKSAVRTVDEIPDYTFREIKPGQRSKEEPAPGLDDHGCDAMRYGMMYLDYSIYAPENEKPQPKPGTADEILRISEFMERIRAGEFEQGDSD